MPHDSNARFLVLHGLRLKGFGEAVAVAATVGLDVTTVDEQLAKLQAEELVVHREGRLTGWSLTRDGRSEQERLAQDALAATGQLDTIRSLYGRFLELNDPFKALCTDWQVRDGELYDHTDAQYNETIFARLGDIDASTREVLSALAAVAPRFELYTGRFATALEGLVGGDLDLLTKPIIDSYHTIWFELHEDLITGLGIDRSQEGSH